jgi:hypothetical protein
MTNRLLVVTISTLLIVGCQKGPKLGEVSGVVTFEGEPLEKATVTFTPVDGQMSFDRTEADGSYQLQFADGRPGAMLGENVVSIETYRIDTTEQGDVVEFKEILPAKFHVYSELTRTVESGGNVFNFELTKN